MDIFILFIFIFLSIFTTLVLKTNFFLSAFIFFGPPSIYLSIKKPLLAKNVLKLSLILFFPFVMVADYLAIADGAWFIEDSIAPIRFLNGITIDGFIWGFLFAYISVMFYLYFFRPNDFKINKNIKYLIGFEILLLVVFFFVYVINKSLLVIPYFYLLGGIFFWLIPIILAVFYSKTYRRHSFKIIPYFIILTLSSELIETYLGHWSFPGSHFIGRINLFVVSLPIEEFVFFILLGSVGVVAYYELFIAPRDV